ncbi:Endoplasmic reticulum-Golgi intermediate compartment protein 3 [Vitis vinifera]|uniref:Endoplasmic reticulum-Golgi intermediate compartment protein 3 n=1 Tax=Vitis vinifera TaxID=29760 RepID=A0A438GTB3_VITVI|nr:Endoplasmic reticulum-Golgi intermediate compartment protein 3 [Vitis vinifera]
MQIEKPLQRHGGRLEHNEKYCGSCYGAEVTDDDCCNSCDEVREAYRKKGWGMTNPDLIDQVGYHAMLYSCVSFCAARYNLFSLV